MAAITGARTTTNILSDQLAIDLGDRINLLEPSAQPLAVFSRAAGKRRTVASKFSWLEDKSKPRYMTASAALSTDTAITVSNGTYIQQHDQILITRTGEQIRVDGVAGNVAQVTRGIGSTAAAINNGDEVVIIGSAQPENDTSKPARSDNPVKGTNNTQILRTPFETSGTLMASSFQVNPADWPHQARKAGIEHAKDIEYTFLLGRKSADASGAAERRTSGGVLSFISSNQSDAGGTLTEPEFNAFMLQVMRFGSDSKLALAAGIPISALNGFPASKQMTRNDETTYGMNVTHFTSPFGSLNLVYHRLLEGNKYGGYIIVVDLEEIAYRYLANDELNRDTKVYPNRQPNDQDGRKDEVMSEIGLEVGQESTHGVLTGVSG